MEYKLHSRIKSLREENNLTQRELAKVINIGYSTLSQYESGLRIPSDEIKISIASYFNVTTDYLLGRSNIRNPYSNDDLSLSDHDVIAAHGKTEKVELSEEDLQDIQDFLKQMRKDK